MLGPCLPEYFCSQAAAKLAGIKSICTPSINNNDAEVEILQVKGPSSPGSGAAVAGEMSAARIALMCDSSFSYSPRMQSHSTSRLRMIHASGTSAVAIRLQQATRLQQAQLFHAFPVVLAQDSGSYRNTRMPERGGEALCTLVSYPHERSAELRLPSF